MMPNPFAELPLALFTTFMPLSAGAAFALVACVLLAGRGKAAESDAAKHAALDKAFAMPLVLAAVGFVCAFFHLASPLHAANVVFGIGSSPLSNEVLVAGLYFAAVALYWALGLAGKLNGARKPLAAVVAMLAVVLAVFTGLAYYVPTIVSWASPWPAVEQVGFLLMGTVFGWLALQLVGSDCRPLKAASLIGWVVAAAAVIAHLLSVSGMGSWLASGTALVSAAMPYAVVGSLLCLAGTVVAFAVARKRNVNLGLNVAACGMIAIGVFAVRLSFYCLQLNIGL